MCSTPMHAHSDNNWDRRATNPRAVLKMNILRDVFHKVVPTRGPGSGLKNMRNTLIKFDTLTTNLKDNVHMIFQVRGQTIIFHYFSVFLIFFERPGQLISFQSSQQNDTICLHCTMYMFRHTAVFSTIISKTLNILQNSN